MEADQCATLSIPVERIVDIDIYNIPGADHDLHWAWRKIQKEYPHRILWTPCNGGHWLVTRADDIARIYADHKNFSSRITIVPKKWGEKFPLRPTTLDPPEHRPYRKLMTAALTRTHVQAGASGIKVIIAEAIARVLTLRHCEFINDVAIMIPARVFLHMAAIPDECAAQLPRYGEEPNASNVPVMDRFANFLRPWVIERQACPGDDLLSRLVCGELDGRPISEDEAVDVATAMLTGGIDTVVSILGFIMSFLAQHPEHRQVLVYNPELIASAVPEFIRRFPIMTKARQLKTDQVIDGMLLKAGDMIVLPPLQSLDEKLFDSPMEVDFSRPLAPNMTFGSGVHFCPGTFLASTELELFLCEWLDQIPEFRLQAHSQPKMSSGILGAMLELKLQW